MELETYIEDSINYKKQYYKKHVLMSEDERYRYQKASLKEQYDKLLTQEANLLTSLVKQDNPDIYFSVYYYLLWNGYLSKDNDFTCINDKKEVNANLGLNIACGNGCCRNVSIHFNNIMNKINSNRDFILVGTRYKKPPKSIEDTKSIKQQIDEDSKKYTVPQNKYFQNHAESFYIPSKKVYDPLNFNIQTMNYDSVGEENFIGTFDLGLENIFGIDYNMEERLDTLDKKLETSKLLTYVKKEKLPPEKLIALRDMGIDICESNKEILEEHQEENKHIYEYIKKTVNNYK